MVGNFADKIFAGSIPKIYDKHLVPLIFQPYANDLARRLATHPVQRVLEIAAGTGAVTRALASLLPVRVEIVATDLNQTMLDRAAAIGTSRPVTWKQADAMQLPFADAEFDAVICQFGAMFFPDKPKAYAETRRVLRPRGVFLFNVWDRIEENEFADTVTDALATVFPSDAPRFLARTPHGYHDRVTIARDLEQGGFRTAPQIVTLTERSRAPSARFAAIGLCQGTPLRSEIEQRGASRLGEATAAAERALARRFGSGRIEGKMQAHVVAAEKD
jgi:ubiquinone/menaquinone biosynthesis C-methylase UbiE